MLNTAQNALQLHANANANNNAISASAIQTLLANASVTFANIVTVTQVATSAKHKNVIIKKVTTANVQLFNNINTFTSVFTNAVKRSASKITQNATANIANFTAQANYYTHSATCYSIVQHNTNNNLYLYAIYNNATSVYYINNVVATKQQVAQYLTASASKKLLQQNNVVYNVANNLLHTVIVRTIMLKNIVSITANKQTLTVANNAC